MSYYSSGQSTFRREEQLLGRVSHNNKDREREQPLLYSRYGSNRNQLNTGNRYQSTNSRHQSTLSRNQGESSLRPQQQPLRQQQQGLSLRQQVTSTVRNIMPSSHRQTILQQQQINDLQRKIDLILMHNEKLQSQKERYRLLYEQIQQQNQQLTIENQHLTQQVYTLRAQIDQLRIQSIQRGFYNNPQQQSMKTARFVSQQNSYLIDKLRKQLQLTTQSYQQKLQDSLQSKQILKQQLSTLNKIIQNITQQNKSLKLSIKQQSLKTQSLTFQLKQQFIRQQAQLENKLRDEFLIRQIQLKNQRKQIMQTYQQQQKEMKELMQKLKLQQQQRKQRQINTLLKQFEQDKQQLTNRLRQQHQQQKQSLNSKHRQQLKRQHDKAIQYINSNISNLQQNNQLVKQQYQQQIHSLKQSLQTRKQLIDALLSNTNGNNNNDDRASLSINTTNNQLQLSYLPQLITMKHQLQQQTTHFLQQSQLLKLKLTQKHHTDILSLKHLYQSKIQLLTQHTYNQQQQCQRLRTLYENALQQNIKLKKQHQLEKSQLKNVIRKLNIQLHGIQQEYKLNIQGVRSMNNTFSMTMMKSMIQVKQKANFYTQQNRKLRKSYQQHQLSLQQDKKLLQQKLSYYQQKYISQRQKSTQTIQQLKHQLQLQQQQAQQRQSQLRDNLNKQHQMIHEVVSQLRRDLQQMEKENLLLKKESHQISAMFKDKDYQITHLKSLINQLHGDIEKLKLDLQMAGVDDKQQTDTINQWKNHYQTTISQLNQQIQILQSKLNTKHQQLTQIIKKYQLLQSKLNKVIKTINKKSQLQTKVLQVGLDNNLVHNLAQLFPNINKQQQIGNNLYQHDGDN